MHEQLELFEAVDAFSFGNFPTSITEYIADKNGDPAKWTCRDILIRALRDIDSGVKKPTHMVICYSRLEDGDCNATGFYNKSNSAHESVGLLAEVTHMILRE